MYVAEKKYLSQIILLISYCFYFLFKNINFNKIFTSHTAPHGKKAIYGNQMRITLDFIAFFLSQLTLLLNNTNNHVQHAVVSELLNNASMNCMILRQLVCAHVRIASLIHDSPHSPLKKEYA